MHFCLLGSLQAPSYLLFQRPLLHARTYKRKELLYYVGPGISAGLLGHAIGTV
jgi:hypothetical protein